MDAAFTIEARDETGRARRHGGDDFRVVVRSATTTAAAAVAAAAEATAAGRGGGRARPKHGAVVRLPGAVTDFRNGSYGVQVHFAAGVPAGACVALLRGAAAWRC